MISSGQGLQNPIDTAITESVWKKAADDGEFMVQMVLAATIAVGLSFLSASVSLVAGKVGRQKVDQGFRRNSSHPQSA